MGEQRRYLHLLVREGSLIERRRCLNVRTVFDRVLCSNDAHSGLGGSCRPPFVVYEVGEGSVAGVETSEVSRVLQASESDGPVSVPNRYLVLRCVDCGGAAATGDMAFDDPHMQLNRFPRAMWCYRRVFEF